MSYTEHPSQLSGIVFPDQSMQALSSVIHLLGCSLLAFCLARRTKNLLAWETWSSMTWPRLCALLVFIDSWAFLFSTGILIGGVGMSSSFVSCSLGIFACVLLYAFSKVMIYWFLIEKVHIVWGGTHQTRFQSKVYWLCLITMTPYAAIFIMMLIGRVAFLRPDRACIIGLKGYVTLSLLTYDLYINVFLTGMFLWPLFRSRLFNPRIRKMAMRTLVAACAALTTSAVNIAVLTIMHGEQLGWVCLGSCGTDVTLNALVLFWVTGYVAPSAENTPETPGGALQPTHGPKPTIIATSNMSVTHDDNRAFGLPTPSVLPSPSQSQYTNSMYDYMPSNGRTRCGQKLEMAVIDKGTKGKVQGGKGGKMMGKIGDVFRSRHGDEVRSNQMSVQVTITTEQQEEIMSKDRTADSVNGSIRTGRDGGEGDAKDMISYLP